jgi:hypothetical protein
MGLLIVAPQGAGKTTFCRAHPDWTDSDAVLLAASMMKRQAAAPPRTLRRWARCNRRLKRKNLWVLSSAWWTLSSADAVVLPPVHVLTTRLRAKSGPEQIADPLFEAKKQSALLRTWAAATSTPAFSTIEGAVGALTRRL